MRVQPQSMPPMQQQGGGPPQPMMGGPPQPPGQQNMQPTGMVPPMNNVPQRMSITQKLDFPLEIQVHFKTKNIGHIKSKYRNRCRPFDALTFERPNITSVFEKTSPPVWKVGDKKNVRIKKARKEKKEKNKQLNREKQKEWNPFENDKHTQDPFKTLFISNINYETSEKKIRREFDQFGEIKKVRIVRDSEKENKAKGYCFIEYEHKKDMIQAYKMCDYIKVDGRRLIVDIERGRTLLNFVPRKFGGGLGTTRKDWKNESRSRSRDRKRKSKKDKKRKKSFSSSMSRSRSRTPKKEKRKHSASPEEKKKKSRKERDRSGSKDDKKKKKDNKKEEENRLEDQFGNDIHHKVVHPQDVIQEEPKEPKQENGESKKAELPQAPIQPMMMVNSDRMRNIEIENNNGEEGEIDDTRDRKGKKKKKSSRDREKTDKKDKKKKKYDH